MAELPKIEMLKPTEAQGYLAAAKGMFLGVKPLVKAIPLPVYAITLLCGHTCEASMKALISYAGIEAEILSRYPYGHNLLQLWQATKDHGYTLPEPQPAWVAQLHEVYDKPFHLRYPLGFHGMVFPNQEAMVEGTESLLSLTLGIVK